MNVRHILCIALFFVCSFCAAQQAVKSSFKKTIKQTSPKSTNVSTSEIKEVPVTSDHNISSSASSNTSSNPNKEGINFLQGTITAISVSNPANSKSNVTESIAEKGLKEALTIGVRFASSNLSKVDGFLSNETVKILFPPEAKKVESRLRSIGMGSVCDDVVTSVNRAAESAVVEASPILLSAISNMSLEDALGILKGPNNAATEYLRKISGKEMILKFKPIVEENLNKTNATKYWGTAIGTYNQIPFVDKINPDLTDYVTNKTIDGIFLMVANEEKKIRENPLNRTTDILRNVFGWAETNK